MTPDSHADFQPFEWQLNRLSPFGPIGTAVGLAVILGASFVTAALAGGLDIFQPEVPGPLPLSFEALFAVLLSLIGAAAIVLPETARQLVAKEIVSLKQILDASCHAEVERMDKGIPDREKARYRLSTLAGLVIGVSIDGLIVAMSSGSILHFISPVGLWFIIVGPLLLALAGRGIADMMRQGRTIKEWASDKLIVDFRQAGKYEVFGRMGLHEALSWSVITAILVVFFAIGALAGNAGMLLSGLIIVVISAGVTIHSFFSAIEPVRAKLATVKEQKLAEIRSQIRPDADRLADLIAYESWLDRQPVWPISVPITRRLIIYIVLPLLAWLGAALTEIIANRFAS